MKIDRVSLHHLRMRLRAPFETSFGRTLDRECILLEVFSDGIVGYGECVADQDPGYSYETVQTAWHILRDFLVPAIFGEDISGPEELHRRAAHVRGHSMAKAGLELAIWDLLGKRQERSLQALLGGRAAQVGVGVSVGIQPSQAELIDVVGGYIDQGYRRIKIKIKPGRDVAEAQAVRNAFPHNLLQVDANSAYTLESARILKPMDDLNLLLIEQPLSEDDMWDHSRL